MVTRYVLVYVLIYGATVLAGAVAYWIVASAGLGRPWRMILSSIASGLPVFVAEATIGGPFFVGDVLLTTLAFSGLWMLIVLVLEWRRSRRAKRDALLAGGR